MTVVQTFNFHDLVGFQLYTQDPRAMTFFDAEYQYAKGDLADAMPLISLQWRHSRIPLFQRSGYCFHSHKILARWNYRIQLSDRLAAIEAIGNQTAVPMVHHMMVHPSLRYLSSLRGVIMLHGAAIVHNNRSVILTGRGGAGKTTISSLLLATGKNELQLHADDYVFIGPGPKTYAYLTRSHLYRDLLRWVPEIRSCLTSAERIQLEFFGHLRTATGERIKWPVRLPAERLWPGYDMAQSATLGAVLLLRRVPINEPRLMPLNRMDETVDRLIEMNFYEARHFCSLISAAPDHPLDSNWLQHWRERESELLRARLLEAPVFWLELPQTSQVSPSLGEKLLTLLSPILGTAREEAVDGREA